MGVKFVCTSQRCVAECEPFGFVCSDWGPWLTMPYPTCTPFVHVHVRAPDSQRDGGAHCPLRKGMSEREGMCKTVSIHA